MKKTGRKKTHKFFIVPQTEEEIEHNRKIIKKLKSDGLLEKHEETFRIGKDGTVTEED